MMLRSAGAPVANGIDSAAGRSKEVNAMEAQIRLADLASALTWPASCVALGTMWRRRYILLLHDRVLEWLAAVGNPLISKALGTLCDSERAQVLTSPHVAWRLIDRTFEGLEHWLLYECAQTLASEHGREQGRTCLSKVKVDFATSYICPPREAGIQPPGPLTESQAREAIEDLRSALHLLEGTLPQVFGFIQSSTFRIVLRADLTSPGSFSSGSYSGHAGMSVLTNVQETGRDWLKLLDALVHEAIHAMIYFYEGVVEPICYEHPRDLRIMSPWTGRALTLDQYVQACFVWWGLFNLWTLWPLSGNEQEDGRALRFRQRAESGFARQPLEYLLREVDSAYLPENTVAALRGVVTCWSNIAGAACVGKS